MFVLFAEKFLTPCPGKPMIEPPAPGEVMNQGDTVTLKCSAYGFPTPQFVWTPSGNQVRLLKTAQTNRKEINQILKHLFLCLLMAKTVLMLSSVSICDV